MFVIIVSVLLFHCAIAFPTEEEPIEYREWIPSREAYARDFERWFEWVPWGNSETRKAPTVKDRLKIMDTRLKAIFDLVRCESYDQTDCTPFRTQAETLFDAPAKGDLTPPTKSPAKAEITNSTTTSQNQEQSSTTPVPSSTTTNLSSTTNSIASSTESTAANATSSTENVTQA